MRTLEDLQNETYTRTITEMEALLTINENELDKELAKQSQYLWEASKNFCIAVDKRDTAKAILDTREAQLDNTIRSTSLEKITEAKIDKEIRRHPDYLAQRDAYLAYSREANDWLRMMNVFAARDDLLGRMVQLHATGYFGSGLISHEDRIETLKAARRKSFDEGDSTNAK